MVKTGEKTSLLNKQQCMSCVSMQASEPCNTITLTRGAFFCSNYMLWTCGRAHALLVSRMEHCSLVMRIACSDASHVLPCSSLQLCEGLLVSSNQAEELAHPLGAFFLILVILLIKILLIWLQVLFILFVIVIVVILITAKGSLMRQRRSVQVAQHGNLRIYAD